MTLKEAFLDMAKRWEEPETTERGECFVSYGNTQCFGICEAIDTYSDSIAAKAHDMIRKSHMYQAKYYWWPLNQEGAKLRAEFLRKMAGLCKEGE